MELQTNRDKKTRYAASQASAHLLFTKTNVVTLLSHRQGTSCSSKRKARRSWQKVGSVLTTRLRWAINNCFVFPTGNSRALEILLGVLCFAPLLQSWSLYGGHILTFCFAESEWPKRTKWVVLRWICSRLPTEASVEGRLGRCLLCNLEIYLRNIMSQILI